MLDIYGCPASEDYPREVRSPSLSESYVPGTGEITINCTHTLLEIQDKYKGDEKERGEKKIPVRDTVFPIELRLLRPIQRAVTFHNGLVFLTFLVID